MNNSTIPRDFEGQVALVTGASGGIGEAIAIAFAERGAKVGVHYFRNEQKAQSVVNEILQRGGDAIAVRADVTKAKEVQAMVERVLDNFGGRLDILVNNAGEWMKKTPIAECSEELWDEMMAVNLKSIFLCCRAVIPIMAKQGRGVIVNISSIAGYTGGGGGTVPYAAAKGGVIVFTRGLAKELAPLGIRVNGVAPGVIDTPMQHRFTVPEQLQAWARQVPLGRIGRPEDIVGAVLFLASSQADYITGEIIHVNGGMLMV